jgi:hypothetical protein
MSHKELAALTLGTSSDAAVEVVADAPPITEAGDKEGSKKKEPDRISLAAEYMALRHAKGIPFEWSVLKSLDASEWIQSTQQLVRRINGERSSRDVSAFGEFEYKELILQYCQEFPDFFKLRLMPWIFTVRIGLAGLSRYLNNVVVAVHVPGKKLLPARCNGHIGQSKMFVLQATAAKHKHLELSLRENIARLDEATGEVRLGGLRERTRELDGWKTPGVGKHPARDGNRMMAGLDAALLSTCHSRGDRLDLEYYSNFDTFMTMAESMLAYAVYCKSHEQTSLLMSSFRQRLGDNYGTLIHRDPSLLGEKEATYQQHMKVAADAEKSFRTVEKFVLPEYYLIFQPSATPTMIHKDQLEKLDNVAGNAYNVSHLVKRSDRVPLRRVAERVVEDFQPLVKRGSTPYYCDKKVQILDRGPMVVGEPDSDHDDPRCVPHVVFICDGESDERLMSEEEFNKGLTYKLVPHVMVIRDAKWMCPEFLQWFDHETGVRVDLSQQRLYRCHSKKR